MARIDNRGNLRGSAANAGGMVQGADQFLKVSKALKEAGETGLRKEFHKAIRDAAKPLVPKVKEAAGRELPQAGGLAKRIAKKSYRVQARTGAKTAGVRIVGSGVDPRIDAQGRVYHPVFGRPGSGVVQSIPAAKGYFTETLNDSAPQVRDAVTAEIDAWARRIAREMDS